MMWTTRFGTSFTLARAVCRARRGVFRWPANSGTCQDEDGNLVSYSIITTSRNDFMKPLHDRMPVILEADSFDLWLEPDAERGDLETLLKPYEGKLEAHKVDKRVGKVDANDAGLIKPVDEKKH